MDPLKDVEANRAAVAAGFKSPTQVINEMGGDREDVYQEIAQDRNTRPPWGCRLTIQREGRQMPKAITKSWDRRGGEALPSVAVETAKTQVEARTVEIAFLL